MTISCLNFNVSCTYFRYIGVFYIRGDYIAYKGLYVVSFVLWKDNRASGTYYSAMIFAVSFVLYCWNIFRPQGQRISLSTPFGLENVGYLFSETLYWVSVLLMAIVSHFVSR